MRREEHLNFSPSVAAACPVASNSTASQGSSCDNCSPFGPGQLSASTPVPAACSKHLCVAGLQAPAWQDIQLSASRLGMPRGDSAADRMSTLGTSLAGGPSLFGGDTPNQWVIEFKDLVSALLLPPATRQ